MGDLHAAGQAILHHPLFGFGITLGSYQLALALYERTKRVYLQPVLVSMALVIALLLVFGINVQEYKANVTMLTVFLGPTTVALAVPLFMNFRRIRLLLWPTLITLLAGATLATALGIGFGWLFGVDHVMQMTLLPKSVTSPIAMLVAEQIGGIAALAAVFVLITGVIGAIFGPPLMTRLGVRHPAARGMALGITSHAIGTAQALQEGEETAAFSALGMSLTGVLVAIFVPLLVSLLG